MRVRGAELSALIAVPLITLALTWFLARTDTGKAVRAAAANPDRARLSAINPKLLSTLVWTVSGVLTVVLVGLLFMPLALALTLLAGTELLALPVSDGLDRYLSWLGTEVQR